MNGNEHGHTRKWSCPIFTPQPEGGKGTVGATHNLASSLCRPLNAKYIPVQQGNRQQFSHQTVDIV